MIKFKNKEQIQDLSNQTEDYQETKRLISKFKKFRMYLGPTYNDRRDKFLSPL
jgi:acetone carboxylase gamma subunit